MTEGGDAGADPIDRAPPIAFFLSGESFLKCATYAHEALDAKTLRLRFHMPVYYLYSHAIELIFKAFLRAKGLTEKELQFRAWGHDLLKLWEGCVERGLALDLPTRLEAGAVIDLLASYATNYEFRYVKVGAKTLPTLGVVREAAQALQAAIKPTVVATVGKPILD